MVCNFVAALFVPALSATAEVISNSSAYYGTAGFPSDCMFVVFYYGVAGMYFACMSVFLQICL